MALNRSNVRFMSPLSFCYSTMGSLFGTLAISSGRLTVIVKLP